MTNENDSQDNQEEELGISSSISPASLPPVFDTTKCDVDPVDPIPEEPWFDDTTIPEAPDDIDDCSTTPVPQPELEIPCPEITVEGDPRGGAVYTKVVPHGQGRAELRIEKGDCCDYDLQLDLDFPCVQLRSTDGPLPPDGQIPATVTIGAVPSATLIAKNSDDCVFELGLNIVFPAGGGAGFPGATGATGPVGPPGPEISLEEGCGITIDELFKVSIDPEDFATAGTFEWVNMNCPERVLNICSPGGDSGGVAILQGLLRYEQPADPEECPSFFSEVNLPYHCSLTITPDGYFSLNYEIFTNGLTLIQPEFDGCPEIGLSVGCHFEIVEGRLELNLAAIAGDGLSVDTSGECPKLTATSSLTGGCGIDIIENIVSIDYTDIAVDGQYAWVNNGCTATVLTTCSAAGGNAGVAELQGLLRYQLETSGPIPCEKLFAQVNLPYDCSLDINNGALSLNYSIFTRGLAVLPSPSDGCPEIGLCVEDATLPIAFSEMIGTDVISSSSVTKAIIYGQVHYDPTPYPEPPEYPDDPDGPDEPDEPEEQPCKVFTRSYLPVGCHFGVAAGTLSLDLEKLAGKGLSLGPGDECETLKICAENGTSPVSTDQLAGTNLSEPAVKNALVYGEVFHEEDLSPIPGCGRLVTKSLLPVGCHFNLDSNKLELDLASLAGAGIGIEPGDCPKLQVDLQTLLCSVPIATPAVGDFVIGLRFDGLDCQVVRFPVTACPTDEGGDDGGGPAPPPGP